LALASRNELLCGALSSFFGSPELPIELFGLRFPNPIGLAAGMDKDAQALPAWAALGFGFTELGAVTWHPQPGNPEPRVFRAIAEEAIVNRMGFNNCGAVALAQKLAQWRQLGFWPRHPVGVNLGKSKITPLEKAAEDYANSFRVLKDHLDFFVVNVSSPNTPDLRQLQDKSALDEILAALQQENIRIDEPTADSAARPTVGKQDSNPRLGAARAKPVLIKVAPDLTFAALDEILELVVPRQIDGMVATNTTITRPQTNDPESARVYGEAGGLSGRPLRERSTEVIRHLYRQTRGTLPIIGVGGIFSAAHAWEKITAGASLLQVYTGLVYEGPGLAKSLVLGLQAKLEENGRTGLLAAIGGQAVTA
jgi:dihydroorotate dehydrogenase